MLDTDTELDIIYNGVEDYLEAEKYNTVNLIFSQVDVDKLPIVLTLGFLAVSFLWQDDLKQYKPLARECYLKRPDLALNWKWIENE